MSKIFNILTYKVVCIVIFVILILMSIYLVKEHKMNQQKKAEMAEYDMHMSYAPGQEVQIGYESHMIDIHGKPFFYFSEVTPAGRYLGGYGNIVFPMHEWEIPNKMKFLWFSIRENQFYQGEFQLPYEQLKAYFREEGLTVLNSDGRYDKPAKYERFYTTLNFFVAPKGKMIIYADGIYGTRILGQYQATPVDYDWWQWSLENASNREEYEALKRGERSYVLPSGFGTVVDINTREQELAMYLEREFSLEDLEEHKQLYDERFLQPVQWTLRFKGDYDKLLALGVNLFNGESYNIHTPKPMSDIQFYAVPKNITFDFVRRDEVIRYSAQLMSEQPTFNFYDRFEQWLKHVDISQPFEVHVNLMSGNEIEVSLEQHGQYINLDNYEVYTLER